MLKYKISYGEQGNDGIGNYRYTDRYNITNSNNEVAFVFSSKGNRNITWETVGSFNTGIEFELFNSRLRGTVDYYDRKTRDMLIWFSAPTSIGYSGYYDNVGDMVNRGVEIDLSGDIIATRDFTWTVGLNMSWQHNEVTYLPEDKKGYSCDGYNGYSDSYYFVGEGLPMYTWRVKRYAGVNDQANHFTTAQMPKASLKQPMFTPTVTTTCVARLFPTSLADSILRSRHSVLTSAHSSTTQSEAANGIAVISR